MKLNTSPASPVSHSYGTRIQHNIRIKPSARLVQTPPPQTHRRTKSSSQAHPIAFPPPHVVLHPDDANSKVFLALARSLMSVDNRAMTIKDLAEMTVSHGLVCQNVSAASQAITTYIRTHMQRCEDQDDLPLLLRHTLSGTPSDDDLLPALHSRSGGAHCVNADNRVTNFRRGTTVWYLSRATGAPCPFAQAGIMICEYGEDGRVGSQASRDKRRQVEDCGKKRKRTLRGCTAADSDSESSIEAIQPPPKVKLMLRLKPLRAIVTTSAPKELSDHDDSMSDSSDEEEEEDGDDRALDQSTNEKQPWSLPPYPRRSISIPCYTPSVETPHGYFYPPQTPYQRSSSVPYSVASLPPDSEEDYDDNLSGRRSSLPDSDWDADDSEGDAETTWESPGPRSPSAPVSTEVSVKEEPDMLDDWDDFGADTRDIKVEPTDGWNWQFDAGRPWAEEDDSVKLEDDLDSLSSSFDLGEPGSFSPPIFGQRRVSDAMELDLSKALNTVRPRSKTAPSLSSFFSSPVRPPRPTPSLVTQTLASLIQTMSMNSPTAVSPTFSFDTPCISPLETRCQGWNADMVVVNACVPCTPAICATQIEGISVYQMRVGSFKLLRRLDTDFVNLSPIVAYSGAPSPVLSTIPNAVVITRGSSGIPGTWVPLATAQAYVRDHPVQDNVLDTFLSDTLFERFPVALQDFNTASSSKRKLNQFGPHFGSTLQATQLCSHGERKDLDVSPLLQPPVFVQPPPTPAPEQPLNSAEQEMFQELCVTTDWDCTDLSPPPSPLSDVPSDEDHTEVVPPRSGRPLRRSKRVADAKIAARSRPRRRT
ncbi:hypothetical protein FB45DRAFT_831592 [Roridomyces roridus]|uniref:GDS1 winged helix domain-containing protein n=1 Tax=Roridomyces roridus TaxID=1738132 RepID=A0AAD7BWJ1_9AGAR|nr:hypothetical protein FB45DRAFT_831592 [Roridomyces roridus]